MRLTLTLVLCASLGCGRRDAIVMSAPPDASPKADSAPLPPDDEEEMPPTKTPLPPPTPTPTVATCNVSCPRLEPIGPVVELMPPHEESMGQSAITYAGDRWYVAWGGRPTNVTHLQRLTRDGQPDGSALRIEGTTPAALQPNAAGDGLFLLGWVPPAYTAAGRMSSVHTLGLDLAATRPPILLRMPGTVLMGQSVEAGGAAGELLLTSVLDRPGGLVRQVRIPASATAGAVLSQRDWRPGPVDVVRSFDRIGDQQVFLDVAGGALRMRPLLDDGTIGAPTSILDIPAAEGRQVVFSRRVGNGWWVGAWAATNAPIVRLRAVDPQTRAGLGEVVTLKWPVGTPSDVVDANGTPMLLGHLAHQVHGISLVPVDAAARAACTPHAVLMDTLRGRYQTIRAIHFQGDTAGVTLDSWASGPRRVFFTRLRCKR